MNIDNYLKDFTLLHPKSIDLSLERIYLLLKKLGNPQKKLPPIIHVAGTNGKGSVVSFLRSILEANNYKVQTYTSPHLIYFNERIRLADGYISKKWLEELFYECSVINKKEPITFFEITTAAAFLAFSRSNADFLILEVGLGGKFDTTNTIDNPILTAITHISLDHTDFIGPDLKSIAKEKSGIIKTNVPLVVCEQQIDVKSVILDQAKIKNSPTIFQNIEWSLQSKNNENKLFFKDKKLVLPKLSLKGSFQLNNAAQATICALSLGAYKINNESIIEGLSKADWPGRMQKLNNGLLAKKMNMLCDIWLDSGHNPGAGEALFETINELNKENYKKTFVILGMMKKKDLFNFLKPLSTLIEELIAIPIPGEKLSYKPIEIIQESNKLNINSKTSTDLLKAIEYYRKNKKLIGNRILICGSIYLAGKILEIDGYKVK